MRYSIYIIYVRNVHVQIVWYKATRLHIDQLNLYNFMMTMKVSLVQIMQQSNRRLYLIIGTSG